MSPHYFELVLSANKQFPTPLFIPITPPLNGDTLANRLREAAKSLRHRNLIHDDLVVGKIADSVYIGPRQKSATCTERIIEHVRPVSMKLINPPDSVLDAVCWLHHGRHLTAPTTVLTHSNPSHYSTIYDITINSTSDPNTYVIQ